LKPRTFTAGFLFLNDNETLNLPLLPKTKMKPLLILLFLPLLVFCYQAKSQSITEKDFRLMIDGKTYSDSTNLITVTELLKMQEVTANFSWITVKRVFISFDFVKKADRDRVYDGVEISNCLSNIICKDARELIKKMQPGHTVIISVDEAVNRQGIKVNIKDLVFLIK
jgi:hypothetical protein